MNSIAILTLSLTLFGAAGASAADHPAAGAATTLDKQSLKTLGVHVRALGLLFDADPGTFLLKDALVHDGAWSHLLDLQKAGLVTHTSFKSAEGELVQIKLTAKGQAVRKALSGP
jgi:hypothetical protein